MDQTDAPQKLPVLPLRNNVLFPKLVMPLVVGRPTSVAAVEAALATEDKTLVIVSQKDAAVQEAKVADLFSVGTQAVIKKMDRADDVMQIVVQGIERVELVALEQETPYLIAEIRPVPRPEDWDTETEALHRAVLELAAKVGASADVRRGDAGPYHSSHPPRGSP